MGKRHVYGLGLLLLVVAIVGAVVSGTALVRSPAVGAAAQPPTAAVAEPVRAGAATIAVGAALAGTAAPPVAPRATGLGINLAASSGSYLSSPAVLAALGASRPAWVRVFLGWNAVEPQQGVYNTADINAYEQLFASLPSTTKIDVDIEGSPAWANGGSSDIRTPPVNDAGFAAFASHLVTAFHGRVSAWEIWNEEDSTAWWTGTPTQYVALLAAAHAAIKAADPQATVIVGGLVGNDAAYLRELYAAHAGGSFDAVGLHTDTGCNITSPYVYEYNSGTHTINQYFFLGFTSVRAVMLAAGDGAKPIYMTELGWSSTVAECETGAWAGKKLAGVTQQTQATYLTQAYHCLAQPEYSYVKAAMWFELSNDAVSTAPLDNFGLLAMGGSEKPAFAAFTQESLHGDALTAPCGAFAPPAITVLAPTRGLRYRGTLKISVKAGSSTNGVHEITIALTSTSRIHFIAKGFPARLAGSMTWHGAKTIALGPHTITFTATDRLGNSATTAIHVIHVGG